VSRSRALAGAIALGALLATACGGWNERQAQRPSLQDEGGSARVEAEARRAAYPPIRWRRSLSLGLPHAGRLVNGVRLPAEGPHFFTWDPVRRRKPNRPWRRYGSDRLVRAVLRVLDEYAAAHPRAPRVGIGDLSRPHGGDFGPRFGKPGHVSHQNGLDVDVYYPRKDEREAGPSSVRQVDRPLAQDLVDRFVRAGARLVFVGFRVGLRGPPRIVQRIPYHENHLHVRLPPERARRTAASAQVTLGTSALGRPIRAVRLGEAATSGELLVVGCIHGNECAGTAVTKLLAERRRVRGRLWVVHNLNPDGLAAGSRQNGRGVDLNRNFASEWRLIGRRWNPQYSGPRPFSEPETRIARDLILRVRPEVTVWFHQPQALVRAWGASVPQARRYARLAAVPFRAIRWPAGTAPNWQNHRFPGTSSFVVELPPGPLPAGAAARYAEAVLTLAAR
jgi:Zinc carboxypeptidase/Penicillin-insensitive murein endopeptidase